LHAISLSYRVVALDERRRPCFIQLAP
jgi:hypothetical protein